MRLLCDENVPRIVIDGLEQDGHDVVWIAERKPGAPDEKVLAIAFADNRLLVTFDKGFGEQAGAAPPDDAPGFGIVLLRFSPERPAQVLHLVRRALLLGERLHGSLTIVRRGRVRRRPLGRR